ncbi:hypothetical protein AWJ09_04600 [Vibrio cholerae]|uniref:hypothetical protein n=1 Tax=Vibrio cholerae TaxID=666 RepID=UPI0007C50492|nr:hypothetical protein [Vibrio cholerae]KAA1217144.1 hypothetical protein F0Q05_07095 [Vibrio cholerae]KAA1219427.1 hypothetical protein F0P99_08520 [Vibrio cholerae]MTB75186.1 hypothetical protein [Vibrio cholerae O1 biovar El Tor]OAE83184.1 hypothetical protein AWJ09_04600 [Vibrio cholerae]TYW51318.1 hypothetical protein FY559_16585 [Vibrio cholerae]
MAAGDRGSRGRGEYGGGDHSRGTSRNEGSRASDRGGSMGVGSGADASTGGLGSGAFDSVGSIGNPSGGADASTGGLGSGSFGNANFGGNGDRGNGGNGGGFGYQGAADAFGGFSKSSVSPVGNLSRMKAAVAEDTSASLTGEDGFGQLASKASFQSPTAEQRALGITSEAMSAMTPGTYMTSDRTAQVTQNALNENASEIKSSLGEGALNLVSGGLVGLGKQVVDAVSGFLSEKPAEWGSFVQNIPDPEQDAVKQGILSKMRGDDTASTAIRGANLVGKAALINGSKTAASMAPALSAVANFADTADLALGRQSFISDNRATLDNLGVQTNSPTNGANYGEGGNRQGLLSKMQQSVTEQPLTNRLPKFEIPDVSTIWDNVKVS